MNTIDALAGIPRNGDENRGRAGFLDILGMALYALQGNWVRSTLTALGVIIGIAAVIVMVSVGQGTQKRLDETMARLGSNRIEVMPSFGRNRGARMGAGSTYALTTKDAVAIRDRIPGATYVSGMIRGGTQVIAAEQNWSTQWYGVEADYFVVNDWQLSRGQFFAGSDYSGAATHVVIGETVREKLFGDGDAIGNMIRVGRVPFTVIGEVAPKGESGWGGDMDDVLFVPLETARRRLMGQLEMPPGTLMRITVGTSTAEELSEVEAALNELLRELHKIEPGAEDDFRVRNLTELVGARTETTRLMSLLLAAVATISLIVGGIGIMNIMLVSVTERIREIGLRMAIGATPGDIQKQFLAEAMMISLGGGFIGIAIGVGGAMLASKYGSLPIELNLQVIALATGFAVATGLFFGFYPAQKAAKLDPIEALRQ